MIERTRHLRRIEELFSWSPVVAIKRTTAPKVTRSMHSALEDLGLERLDVVHAGEKTFPLRERVRALSLSRLWEDLEPLG